MLLITTLLKGVKIMDVLIIDDEHLIREGLATNIDWASLGFNSVSTAEDGMEALALIDLAPPDLILTDVRMPFMTGLEFSERVRQVIPDVCIIIISGHEEFSYAQAALRLAVFDYILKPINLKELTTVVLRAKAFIEEKRLLRENVYYEQISNKPIKGSGNTFFQQAILEESPDAMSDCDIRSFDECLLNGSRKDVMAEFSRIQSTFQKKESCSKIILQLVCSNLFFACKHALEEQGGTLEAIFDHPVETFRSVISQPSIVDMFGQLSPLIITMLDYRDALINNQFFQDAENAKKYIRQNYRDINLSLNMVASHVNMSPCYFSVMFKKETGQNFINYLTNIRIEKAKELLRSTNLKSYEIAYQVGYDNPTYFSTVFKKLTGMTPLDYKKDFHDL